MLPRALIVWLLLLTIAVMNGAFREAVLTPTMGAQWAHVLSTVMLSALILALTRLSIGWVGVHTKGDALFIGVLWTALVLAFELLAGHFLFGHPWDVLVADYDLLRGRVWIAVLIVTLLAPLWAYRMSSTVPD